MFDMKLINDGINLDSLSHQFKTTSIGFFKTNFIQPTGIKHNIRVVASRCLSSVVVTIPALGEVFGAKHHRTPLVVNLHGVLERTVGNGLKGIVGTIAIRAESIREEYFWKTLGHINSQRGFTAVGIDYAYIVAPLA